MENLWKSITFTFSRQNSCFVLYTRSLLADIEDKETELDADEFPFYMNNLTEKYNARNIAVLFDYEN